MRKEKKKELEQLQKNDKELPEDNELDRITERATLKHSKSSKNLHFVAKHADNTVKNQVLAAKDKKRRQLIEKAKPNSEHSSSAGEDSEHDPQDNDETNYNLPKDPNNPWTNNEDQLLKRLKFRALRSLPWCWRQERSAHSATPARAAAPDRRRTVLHTAA